MDKLQLLFTFMIAVNCVYSQGDVDSIAFSVELEDYVVTAQYEPTHYKEALHNVKVLNKETISGLGAVTLEQVIAISPSVRLYNDPILGTSISMRGVASSNVAVLIDGIPVIGRNDGAIDLSQISMHNVERVEIVEGPLSNIYGNNAAGGVINIITKKSQLNELRVNLDAQYESINQKNLNASIGYQISNFLLQIHGRYFDYNQFASDSLRILETISLADGSSYESAKYPFNPKTQYSYGASLRYNINGDNNIIFKYDLNDESATDYGSIKRPQFRPYALDQFYNTARKDLSLSYNGKIKEHFYINSSFSSNNYDRIRDDKRFYLETMEFDSLLQTQERITFTQLFNRTSLNYTGIKDWTLGLGYNFTKETGKGERLLDRTNQDSLFTSFNESAIYSDIKFKGLKNTHLSISNRMTFHSVYTNAFTTSFQSKFDFTPKLSLRLGYSEGYRSPALKELYLEFIDINHHILGNPDLQPERSKDIQGLVSYSPSKNWSLSMNAYYTTIKDQISLTEYETLKFTYSNIDQFSVYGFQPTIGVEFGAFKINSSATLGYWSTELDTTDVPSYGEVFDLNNTVQYQIKPIGVKLLLNHRFVGAEPRYRLVDEEVVASSIESYHLIDFTAAKSFWKGKLKTTLGVRNLTNTQFTNVSGTSSGGTHGSLGRNAISVGRSYFASVSIEI